MVILQKGKTTKMRGVQKVDHEKSGENFEHSI